MRDRTAGSDAFDEEPSAVKGQTGVTVGHEDLRCAVSPDTSTTPEVFVMIKPSRVNNAHEQYT
jgi:hypothetical protein